MKSLYIFLFLSLLIPVFFCCQAVKLDEGEILYREAKFFMFNRDSGNLATRAGNTYFNTGDEIGIFAVEQNTSAYAHNKHYHIDNNGNLTPVSESDKIYLSPDGTYDIYAYYPYSPSYYDLMYEYDFVAKTDQSKEDNFIKSDLMYAQNLSGITGDNADAIGLEFKRKFALVEVNFKKSAGNDVTAVQINNCFDVAMISIGGGKAETADYYNSFQINMRKYAETGNYYNFHAYIPAQSLSTNNTFLFTINGRYKSYTITSPTLLEAGKKHTFNINMQYRINTTVRGKGTITGAGIYDEGTQIHLTAIPAPDYYFDGWYENEYGIWDENLPKLSASENYYFTATKNNHYIAVFKREY